jgi:hypothetical protein
MLNRRPVQGNEQTLLPEESTVSTCTTPGPFTKLEQEPCTATPLIQTSVKVGEVMRLPVKSTLTGFKIPLLVFTKMRKAPTGSEP